MILGLCLRSRWDGTVDGNLLLYGTHGINDISGWTNGSNSRFLECQLSFRSDGVCVRNDLFLFYGISQLVSGSPRSQTGSDLCLPGIFRRQHHTDVRQLSTWECLDHAAHNIFRHSERFWLWASHAMVVKSLTVLCK